MTPRAISRASSASTCSRAATGSRAHTCGPHGPHGTALEDKVSDSCEGAAILSLRIGSLPVRWRVSGAGSLCAFAPAATRPATPLKPGVDHQAQLADPLDRQHRPDRLTLRLEPTSAVAAEHAGGIGTDRPAAAVGQRHDQVQHPAQALEPTGPQQPPEQRMRRRRHPNLGRQHRSKMLQSVAIPPGTGKTHLAIGLAIGLAIRACQAGHRVLFATASEWVARLAEAHHTSRLQAELVKLGRIPLLVVDEVGYIPFEAEAANLFFQLVSSRYERASLIVTSNKPFGRWGEVFGDDIVAAAMIDRLVHHADVIALKGDSYRLNDRDLGRVPTSATDEP